jgi:hypothetical protein
VTIFGEVYKLRNFTFCNFLQHPIISSLLDPDNILSALFSNSLTLYASSLMSETIFTPIQNNEQNYNSAYLNVYDVDGSLEDMFVYSVVHKASEVLS